MEATMADMINGGGGTEGGTQGQHDANFGGTQTQQGGTHAATISIGETPLFEDEQPQVTKIVSRRTVNFCELEDICLCEAWMKVVQDPILWHSTKGQHILEEDLQLLP
jgi:hypothetical protein